MKINLLIVGMFLLPYICFSQTHTPNVTVSSGGDFKLIGYAQISWTLGDFQTETYSKNELILTQGFLQSNLYVEDPVSFEEIDDVEIKVFPNPVKDILNIQINTEGNQKILWELINQNGSVIETSKQYNSKNSKINFTSYKSGIYFVRTFSKNGGYLKVFKVVYLN